MLYSACKELKKSASVFAILNVYLLILFPHTIFMLILLGMATISCSSVPLFLLSYFPPEQVLDLVKWYHR